MTWNTTTRRVLMLAVCVLPLSMTACGGERSKGHVKAVNAANDRWLSLRSNMMLKLAQQQFDTGDLDQSEKTLVEAISTDPKNARLYLLAGRLAIERGQLERSYTRLATAIELDASIPETYYFQGIVLQRWQRYDEALAAYQKASELQSDNPSFLLAVSEMFVSLNRVEEATALLKSRVRYFDQNAGIRVAIAQLALMRKDAAEASDYLKQASLLRPDDTQITENLAVAQLAAGQTVAAIETLERLCANPLLASRRDLQRSLANAYMQAGRTSDAKKAFVRLTQTNAADVESWIDLGQLAWSQEDQAGALLAANRAMSLAPKRHEGYVLAGLVWQKRDRLDEALRLFDRAAELAPQSAEPVLLRGLALQRNGRKAEAAKAYAEALRREPSDSRAQQLLATVSEASERQ